MQCVECGESEAMHEDPRSGYEADGDRLCGNCLVPIIDQCVTDMRETVGGLLKIIGSLPRCGLCTFFTPEGQCRRYPPQITVTKNGNGDLDWQSVLPWVGPEDWCGEFKT
jgi:hypothetical protein